MRMREEDRQLPQSLRQASLWSLRKNLVGNPTRKGRHAQADSVADADANTGMRYGIKVLDRRGELMITAPESSRIAADALAQRFSRGIDLSYVWDSESLRIASIWRGGWRIDRDAIQLELGMP